MQPLLRNTIRFYQKEVNENDIVIGQTKIGGRPDLPKEISWGTETNMVKTRKKSFYFSIVKNKKQ